MTVPAPLRHAAGAFLFLTRLRLPAVRLEAGEVGRTLAWFPLVGLVLGAAAAGATWGLSGRLAAPVLAALLVAGLAWITGGLHLDGLADVADGLGGGHGDRARSLAIMRDSRIGAFGATALALLLLVKVAAVAEVIGRGDWAWVLACAPALARFAAAPVVVLFPCAHPDGLGRAFHDGAGARELAIAGALTLALLIPVGLPALVPALGALATAVAFAFLVNRRLGGLTGDVYGAAMEIAETVFLVLAGAR